MPYKLTFPDGMESILGDAMWWKFNANIQDATPEQKNEHAQARVKEFMFEIVRSYRLATELEATVSAAQAQINTDIAAASAATTIDYVT